MEPDRQPVYLFNQNGPGNLLSGSFSIEHGIAFW
jgi:hypothetical protein